MSHQPTPQVRDRRATTSLRLLAVRASVLCIATLAFSSVLAAQRLPARGDFRTDLSKTSIDLSELMGGGPPKDGIPAIDNPRFETVEGAAAWIDDKEPVLTLSHGGETRVYPLQILIWHEMANDQIGDLPVLVSYCPLCNSAIVFDRRIEGKTYSFGVSGMLRHSDMVMYDRQTDSLWQQLTGEAIVGELLGKRLEIVSSQIVDFGSVRRHFPEAKVLSRNTGHQRPYGDSPYVGYEFGGRTLFPVKYKGKLKPLERLLTISAGGKHRGYRMQSLKSVKVKHAELEGVEYAIFYDSGAVSPLDRKRIKNSRKVGSVGVFSPQADGRRLSFQHKNGKIVDAETGSEWNLFGVAVDGPLKGERLKPIEHGVFYAFAWMTFHPETEIVR